MRGTLLLLVPRALAALVALNGGIGELAPIRTRPPMLSGITEVDALMRVPLKHLSAAFDKADADGSGKLDAAEFSNAVSLSGARLGQADVAALFGAADVDSDGTVTSAPSPTKPEALPRAPRSAIDLHCMRPPASHGIRLAPAWQLTSSSRRVRCRSCWARCPGSRRT